MRDLHKPGCNAAKSPINLVGLLNRPVRKPRDICAPPSLRSPKIPDHTCAKMREGRTSKPPKDDPATRAKTGSALASANPRSPARNQNSRKWQLHKSAAQRTKHSI